MRLTETLKDANIRATECRMHDLLEAASEIERMKVELQAAADDATRAYAKLVNVNFARKTAQAQVAELQAEIVRLEPMRQRAADIERLTSERDALRAELDALREQEPVTAQLRVDGCSTWHSFTVSDARRWLANPWAGIEEVRLLYAAPVAHQLEPGPQALGSKRQFGL